MVRKLFYSSCLFFFLASPLMLHAQKATVSESEQVFTTYPFKDPNPIPVFQKARKEKIYPYHQIDGYSTKSVQQKWKVVKLENDYIEVYVLPEVGGKVLGAIEKSTGNEFLYKNKVLKFRDISLRGPWVSGGIEFNFGIIGHSPSTAAPVDYKTRSNADGSVSCIVGNLDLASRTQWSIEIRLPKDKAYFETNVIWNNPSPNIQSYYNWMTGAVKASDDLEFYFPGDTYLEHSGEPKPWPVDKDGHDLSKYAKNNFGSSKSYHITGATNFMGGYYHKSDYGFGHWSLNEEMPGRKLFLWSLSRDGGIWEDLLTDSDGQYIEFQAGRLLNQYSQGSFDGSIRQVPFESGATDTWKDIWFPVKGIGGIKEVSKFGAMNVSESNGVLEVGINSFGFTNGNVNVTQAGKSIFSDKYSLDPMGVKKFKVPYDQKLGYKISVDGMDIHFDSKGNAHLKRPFATKPFEVNKQSPSWYYYAGRDYMASRDHPQAKLNFLQCLKLDPFHLDAMANLGEIYFEGALYDSALYFINKGLLFDTYHPALNFQAGNVYKALHDFVNATESFGWAARSLEFRTAAYAQMAEIAAASGDSELAFHYGLKSLDFNSANVNALQVLAVQYRKAGDKLNAGKILDSLSRLFPLSHFIDFEHYLLNPAADQLNGFKAAIKNEFPSQTYLELALIYNEMGEKATAISLLEMSPSQPMVAVWNAYLNNDAKLLPDVSSPAFVFPFRRESIAALEWAVSKSNDWKYKYYLALNYKAKGRNDEAMALLKSCGETPDFATFYSTRALLANQSKEQTEADFIKASQLTPDDWRTPYQLTEFYERTGNSKKALEVSSAGYNKFKDNFSMGLLYARQLKNNGQYAACLKVLKNIQVLPFEGSGLGKVVYSQALVLQALELSKAKKYSQAIAKIEESKLWPENLGVGKPFSSEIDERLEDWMIYKCWIKANKTAAANKVLNDILSFNLYGNEAGTLNTSLNNLVTAWALKTSGQQEKATSLLNSWREAQPNNIAAKWAQEMYNGTASELPDALKQNERYRTWAEFLNSPLYK